MEICKKKYPKKFPWKKEDMKNFRNLQIIININL